MKTTLYLNKYLDGKVEYVGYFPFKDSAYAIEATLTLTISAFRDTPIPQEIDVEVYYARQT